MKLKKSVLLAAASFTVAAVGVAVTRVFVAGRKLDNDATTIIQQLALMLDQYELGLKAFVDNHHPNETPEEHFRTLNTVIRPTPTPWSIFAEVNPKEPETLKVFIRLQPELLTTLQRRLLISGLPVDYQCVTDDTGASLGIELQVTDSVLVELVKQKLGQ